MSWFRKKSDLQDSLIDLSSETTDKQELARVEKEMQECKAKIDAITVAPIDKVKEEIKFKKQMLEKALGSYDAKSTQVTNAKKQYDEAEKKLETVSKKCMANLEESGLLKTMEKLQQERIKLKGGSSYQPPR